MQSSYIKFQGCLVGPNGARVCPQGAVGSAGDRVTFRGNKGHRGTGSNGNAGPIDSVNNISRLLSHSDDQIDFIFQNGFAVDPAAVTYLKQIEAYEKWALQQAENNKKIIG